MNTWTVFQAYETMFKYLVSLWEKDEEKYDDLPNMLGDMQLLSDAYPADQACWAIWLESIPGETPDTLNSEEAFAAMLRFLRTQPFKEIVQLADEIERAGNPFDE